VPLALAWRCGLAAKQSRAGLRQSNLPVLSPFFGSCMKVDASWKKISVLGIAGFCEAQPAAEIRSKSARRMTRRMTHPLFLVGKDDSIVTRHFIGSTSSTG
jgi:hypothetical protein